MNLIKMIFSLFFNRGSKSEQLIVVHKKDGILKNSNIGNAIIGLNPNSLKTNKYEVFINAQDVITSSGRYPDRQKYYNEHEKDLKNNISGITNRVNELLNNLGYKGNISITSGLRTPSSNAKAGGAKKSNHVIGKAVDILDDKEQTLANTLVNSQDLLEKYGLYMEDPRYTIGKSTNWVHLQTTPTKRRVFIP